MLCIFHTSHPLPFHISTLHRTCCMFTEHSQNTALILWCSRFLVLTMLFQDLVDLLHRLSLSCDTDDIQFSFHYVDFNQISLISFIFKILLRLLNTILFSIFSPLIFKKIIHFWNCSDFSPFGTAVSIF